MDGITSNDISIKQAHGKESLAPASFALRAGLFVLFLICSLAVFLLGPNYYPLFPTNGSSLYAGGLSAFFLVAALLFKRSTRFVQYWQIAYAFFVAAAVNLMGLACGILIWKTESIWGAFLIHAAADLFLFIALLAVH